MGAFFTNVQVHLAGREADQVRAAIVDAVRRLARAAALVEPWVLPEDEVDWPTVMRV